MDTLVRKFRFGAAAALVVALATFGILHVHDSPVPQAGVDAYPDCPVCALAHTLGLAAVEGVGDVHVPRQIFELETVGFILPHGLRSPALPSRGPPVSA